MDALVDRVSGATGLEPDTARKAIGMVLNFVQSHVTPEQGAALLDAVPGAREAATGAAADEGGGIIDAVMTSPAMGLSGLATQLTSAGLGMSQMQALGRETLAFFRQHAGDGAVDAVLASIPDLKQIA